MALKNLKDFVDYVTKPKLLSHTKRSESIVLNIMYMVFFYVGYVHRCTYMCVYVCILFFLSSFFLCSTLDTDFLYCML